jgi:hypothetical protein
MDQPIKTYANPNIGKLAVRDIDVGLITKYYSRYGRQSLRPPAGCGAGSSAYGYRMRENPARWKDNLDELLPARGKVRKARA